MPGSGSNVWKFFKKIDSLSVSCNLCGKAYKSCNNTTNLATHLKNKHQHAYTKFVKCTVKKTTTGGDEKAQVVSETEQEAESRPESRESNVISPVPSTSLVSASSLDLEVQVHRSEVSDDDQQSQMSISSASLEDLAFLSPPHKIQQTITRCLRRNQSFQEGGQKHTDITQALIYMICKDNLPFSCVEREGFKKFSRVACPGYKLPSRFTVTKLVEQRYDTSKAILEKVFKDTKYIALTSDILTVSNSTRSFLVMTAHFISENVIEAISFSAVRLYQAHTGEYIKENFEAITKEFSIEKRKIQSITTDGGSNMVSAVQQFVEARRIPCMAHLINLVVDGALKTNIIFSRLADQIKSIVQYFKQSVNAMDELRAEQESNGKKEGEVLTLVQSVSTRWNSCFDMLERFVQLSATVAKILASKCQSKRNVPDMVPTSQLNIVRDMIKLLGPFKQATEDISGDKYVTSSLAIPLSNLLKHELELATPSTDVGKSVQESLLKGVTERLIPLEKNLFLAKATILDPHFKKLHFSSPLAVSSAIMELSQEIHLEHRQRGKVSAGPNHPKLFQKSSVSSNSSSSLWSRHEQIVEAASSPAISSLGSVPNELKQYLDQPVLSRNSDTDPIKYCHNCISFTPVIASIALKYLISPASSVSSERVASAVNIITPNNRSRLTGEHIRQRVFLTTLPDKYWYT